MSSSPYNQYNPYNVPPPYVLAQGEKRELRRTSNALCLTLLAAMFLMGIFALYICPLYLKAVGYTGDYSVEGFSGYTPVLYYLANGMGYVVGLSVPVLLYFAIKRIPLSEILPFGKAGFLKTAACVLFGSLVCILANIPANAVVNIEKAWGFSGEMPESPLTNDPLVLILYGIGIAIIPPIVEELLFRGMILQSLRKYGDGFAVVASAVLFALFHGNFVQIVFAFIAGLVMAHVVVRTGSLWTSILIHFINNGISYAMQITQRFAGVETANRMNGIIVMSLLVLGVLSLIYLLIKDKHFFRGDVHNPYLKFSSKLGAVFGNFGGVALLIFTAYSCFKFLTVF
jgi:membrane protease YdiL (CAAX protease family)